MHKAIYPPAETILLNLAVTPLSNSLPSIKIRQYIIVYAQKQTP
ncbi:hypothetical protein [Photobacterium damselae]|nr:hypothetical protein [Photobacterium damselae]